MPDVNEQRSQIAKQLEAMVDPDMNDNIMEKIAGFETEQTKNMMAKAKASLIEDASKIDIAIELLDKLNNKLDRIFGGHTLIDGRWVDILNPHKIKG